VWVLEAAAPAPILFSSSATSALATYSTPIAATIPDGVTAYKATETDTKEDGSTILKLEKITDGIIPAGVGVLLENTGGLSAAAYPEEATSAGTATSAFTATTVAKANAPIYSSTTFNTSATGPITVPADGDNATTYVLANPTGGTGVGLYELSADDRTVSAYKAYFSGPKKTSGSSTAIKLQFPNGATGILNIDGTGVKNAPVYDLTGRRVFKQEKGGLYIQNGKKFIAQ